METVSKIHLGESITFGRFSAESLSWDKWSAFPQNKYVEEVEKCSTPGSVAKKKAYFEAHYRGIGSGKAEQIETHSLKSNEAKVYSQYLNTLESVPQNSKVITEKLDKCSNSLEPVGDSLNPESDLDRIPIAVSINKTEEVVLTETDLSQNVLNDTQVNVVNDVRPESTAKHQSQKKNSLPNEGSLPRSPRRSMNPSTKSQRNHGETDRNLIKAAKESKKNPTRILENTELSSTKSAKTPVPRVPKLQPDNKPFEKSIHTTGKKTSVHQNKKKTSAVEDKKTPVVESKLHSSPGTTLICIESSNTSSTRRGTLIMDSMGDKEIVRRAFKSFRKNFGLQNLSLTENSSTIQQVSLVDAQRKSSAATPKSRIDERKKKTSELKSTKHKQERRSDSLTSGLYKESSGRKTHSNTSSLSLHSDRRAEARRELYMNLETKSNALKEDRNVSNQNPRWKKLRQETKSGS